jgi:RimJ/RimL family protein N-acetyltransferase
MRTLSSERLVLRPWTDQDAQFVFDMYSRWVVQRFIGANPQVLSHVEQARERIRRMNQETAPPHGYWAITLAESGEPVGNVMLRPVMASGESEPLQPSGETEIGWHLHPDFWGKGYATEAAGLVLAYGFESGIPEILALVNNANRDAMEVCNRLGMASQGLTSAYYNDTVELYTLKAPSG